MSGMGGDIQSVQSKDSNSRFSSTTYAWRGNDGEPKIFVYDLELDLEELIRFTKLPESFLRRLLEVSNEYDLLLSVRANDIDKPATRRLSAENDPKDTQSQTKTNYSKTLCSGKIPRSEKFRSTNITYNPLDNNMVGRFPDGSVNIADSDPALVENLKAYESAKILEVRKVNGLICYSEMVDKLEKGTDESGNTLYKKIDSHAKHFIQEAESLRTIVNRLNKGIYKFTHASDGKVYFKDNNGNDIMVDLTSLIPQLPTEITLAKIDSISSLTKFVDDNHLSPYHAPVFYKSEQNPGIYLPVMTHSGDKTGYSISGDADFEHVGMYVGLPPSAHLTYMGKKTDPSMFLAGLEQLQKDLEKTQNPKHVTFKNKVVDALEFYRDNPQLLKGVGVSSIYSLVMQHDFNHALWLHGAEDLHPSSNPERFAGILSVWKGKFVMTGDEKTYLEFLFHDPYVLKVQEIGVHPHWLRHRTEAEITKDGGKDFSQYWLDLVAIQALNRYNDGGKAAFDKYKKDLILRVQQIDRGDVNTVATARIEEKIRGIEANLPKTGPFPKVLSCCTSKDIGPVIDDIYSKYGNYTREIVNKINAVNDEPRLHGARSEAI